MSPALDPYGLIGRTLNEYDVVAVVGNGAFGVVYEGRHVPSNTAVALKVLKQGATFEQIREFDNEAEMLLDLSGATHVVNILDTQIARIPAVLAGSSTPVPVEFRFHVLELATGCLDTIIANRNQVPWNERLVLYRDVVRGVHQMHCKSMVHRDIKSANCLLFPEGRDLSARVSDLGRSRNLKKAPAAGPLAYNWGRGDPNFAPPEMIWGIGIDDPLTHRHCDLYGLGSVLFELATGQGITAVALFPRTPIIAADRALPEAQRQIQYRARLAEIRSWYAAAIAIMEPEVVKEIRRPALDLVGQLCDPDPYRRLPRRGVGNKRMRIQTDLNWLLQRVDILRRILSTTERQRAGISRKRVAP